MNKPTYGTDGTGPVPECDLPDEASALRTYELFLEQGFGEHELLSDWLTKERVLRNRVKVSADTARGTKPKDSGTA